MLSSGTLLAVQYGWVKIFRETSKLALATGYFGGMMMFGALFCVDDAIKVGGPPGTVSALTGLYPCLTLVLTMIARMEAVTAKKLLGIFFAAVSAFFLAKP